MHDMTADFFLNDTLRRSSTIKNRSQPPQRESVHVHVRVYVHERVK